jgi:hypothetical protein
MVNIDNLLGKIENKGATEQGKLTAEEFNTLVRAVIENQGSAKSISYNNGDKYYPDEQGNINFNIPIDVDESYSALLKTSLPITSEITITNDTFNIPLNF